MNFWCNSNVSLYELYNFTWSGINYDREKLIRFKRRYNFLKIISIFFPCYKKEYKALDLIYKSQDINRLNNLLNNDENTIRICLIEKWARISAIDILINKSFSRQTYEIISNLPMSDYKLLLKRVEELVEIANKVANQSNKISENTPGL